VTSVSDLFKPTIFVCKNRFFSPPRVKMCQEENEEMENMKRWRKTRPVVGVCLPHHKQKENFAIFFCGCLFASE
jgi:hypothetical protein